MKTNSMLKRDRGRSDKNSMARKSWIRRLGSNGKEEKRD